ncbi:MAG: bifunctional ornithine acetyltransferase/N-acetylglutamate synthase [Acidobacteria bacterium]|jgi:glutamate N-acetyltransferase/amino-acid N-acetyltransferase|nr:bifunctional ornithine acetyltransferase/N-acetylglutamate synthase [Acidobacteriota bacterium]MDP7478811.1 bifunctional glutamate N-acetyltransferase/amino-acid acetyltransferase ArgJ [Vicinamibacterales bacterium]MDP7691039.1 bifunctional glutamate N-acetyltransferase/amino-acid acetyltransferase ArgJ [Vicinamibacterales bacterium]HJN46211.1 bifunctional glutamate N-acetyltransferase/amino-acid acetyltransferase ArgJ [Vicinamibacterales bacterium]|tara:strand:+ start:4083 stop:5285 length:1203 start_codon:yes stop_codon:yes gene_type:complete
MVESMPGGITAAAGFEAAGVACGIKASGLDLALIVATPPARAAGIFTTNLAVAAPVVVTREHLRRSKGTAAAIVVNSGCANACTGEQGLRAAHTMATDTAHLVGCSEDQVLVSSTGVIGEQLDGAKLTQGITQAAGALGRDGHQAAAEAIMTTDPWAKEAAVRATTPAGVFHVGGMAKGAGMIEPNMATMLAFLTTDAAVEPVPLQRALADAAADTFNAITVDGETSTNDMVLLLAGSRSGVHIDDTGYPAFVDALQAVCRELALAIVKGGEGATKLIAITVTGARSIAEARQTARAIANSPLVKTAVHGGDPNWGRLVAVAGRAGVEFDLAHARVRVGEVELFGDEQIFADREPAAAEHLSGTEVEIGVDVGTGGTGSATVWTCDLSAEYVHINADYRT